MPHSPLQGQRTRGWPGRVTKVLHKLSVADQEEQLDFVQLVSTASSELCTDDWRKNLEKVEAKRGNGLNKLRTYRLFKNQYALDLYVKQIKAPRIRSAMARFLCGVLLHCTMYTSVKESLFKYASYISSDFMSMDDVNKMTFIFTNNAMLLKCARTCYQILDIRKTLVTQV